MKYKPRYSGPGKSGVCVCGHSYEDHHLGMVLNQDYLDQTGEIYVPQECEFYGCNECGGMKPTKSGKWVRHCGSYRDRGVKGK